MSGQLEANVISLNELSFAQAMCTLRARFFIHNSGIGTLGAE